MKQAGELSGKPERDLNRYKSLGVGHFSRLRQILHFWVVLLFVAPLVYIFRRPRIYGREHVPKGLKTSFIVASNHISLWDPPLVTVSVRYPIAYMAKKELFKTWVMAEFFRSQACFALDRDSPDSKTLKTAINVLNSPSRWALGIFPEGTRSHDGTVLPLKKGIGAMAQKYQVPVLPVGIRNCEDGRAEVRIGELITDVSDAEKVQQAVYEALVALTRPV
jgi:1-acyl-sn-glycerol-3-phosphate acyltransferase